MPHETNPPADDLTPTQMFAARVKIMADTFWWNIDALLEVAEVSVPEIEKLDSIDKIMSTVAKAVSTFNADAVTKISAAFQKYRPSDGASVDEGASFLPAIWDEVKSEPWGAGFIMGLHEALRRPPRLPIFLQSTAVSAVSSFEVLFSGLVAQYYSVTPQALEAASREKEKEFSLRELKQMGSLDDAINIAIGRRVDELMFGSFADWRKFCLDKMSLKFEEYAIDWDFLQEVFQRRHVIVHNGGLASRRYIRNVASEYSAGVKEGDLLQMDQAYASRAASELLTFGYLLAMAIGRKFDKEGSETFLAYIHKFNYRNLIKGRYEIVEKCSVHGESISTTMDDRLIFQVNKWIAKQRLSDGSIDPEVESWDVRALSPRYRLAKHCLMGEKIEAMKCLESLYSAGEVSFEDVIEWPLLEPLRGTEAYIAMTRKMEIPDGWQFSNVILFENPKSEMLHRRECSLVHEGFTKRMVDQVDPMSAALCKRCKPVLRQ